MVCRWRLADGVLSSYWYVDVWFPIRCAAGYRLIGMSMYGKMCVSSYWYVAGDKIISSYWYVDVRYPLIWYVAGNLIVLLVCSRRYYLVCSRRYPAVSGVPLTITTTIYLYPVSFSR